jgi:hypothetical protein
MFHLNLIVGWYDSVVKFGNASGQVLLYNGNMIDDNEINLDSIQKLADEKKLQLYTA